MRASYSLLEAPKRGNEEIGSDDAVAEYIPLSGRIASLPLRVAVADGASGSLCAGLWAEQLVQRFSSGRLRATGEGWDMARLASRWRVSAQRRLVRQYGGNLPWYVETKLEAPAQASLLGVEIQRDPIDRNVVRFAALGIGDSCLVHMRQEGVLTTWPISHPDNFDNDPILIAASELEEPVERMHPGLTGTIEPGDRLYLLTDAIAAWFMRHQPESAAMLDPLFAEPPRFPDWLNGQRDKQAVKNDDVTVCRLAFE